MDPKLLNKLFEETNTLIVAQRNAADEAIKKQETETAEYKQANEKRFAEFEISSKKIDEIEKNQAEITRNIEIIKTFQASAPAEQNDKQEKEKVINALRDFARLAGDGKAEFIGRARELNLISTDSNPDGGYGVIPQLEGMKTARFFETSDVRAVADIRRTASSSIKILLDEDEAAASRTNERSAASGTDTPEIKEIEIFVKKYDAEPSQTIEAMEDIYFDVESWLNKKAFDKISRTQNTDFCTGALSSAARGFLTYTAWTTEGTYEFNKIEQLAGGTSANFTADELIELVGKLKSQYMNPRTVMAMNRRTFFNYLLMKKNGFGDYLFLDNLRDAMSGMKFLGIPIKMWDDMPAVGSSTLPIAVGDFSQGYTIVDKPGIRFVRDMYTDKSRIKLYTAVRTGAGVTNFEAIKILKCGA